MAGSNPCRRIQGDLMLLCVLDTPIMPAARKFMLDVEHVTELPASPVRVWNALARFENFGRWHPFIRFGGTPAAGAALDCEFWTKLWPKPLTGAAAMTRFEEPLAIEWRAGLRGLLMVDESYEIAPAASGRGAVIRHRIVWRGIFTRLTRRNMADWVRGTMVEADEALRKYLEGDKGPTKPKSKPAHGTRARRR